MITNSSIVNDGAKLINFVNNTLDSSIALSILKKDVKYKEQISRLVKALQHLLSKVTYNDDEADELLVGQFTELGVELSIAVHKLCVARYSKTCKRMLILGVVLSGIGLFGHFGAIVTWSLYIGSFLSYARFVLNLKKGYRHVKFALKLENITK